MDNRKLKLQLNELQSDVCIKKTPVIQKKNQHTGRKKKGFASVP